MGEYDAGYEHYIDSLIREIEKLQDENDKLSEQVSSLVGRSFRTADKMSCIEADNAKLRESVRRLMTQRDGRLARAEADNAELRELCATVIDDWMSKVCPSFPFCEFGGEYQDCTDETCGNQIYRQMARELGVVE